MKTKTIREWLSKGLTAEHYKLISKYSSRDWDIYKVQSLYSALIESTSWSYTQEGYHFWNSMYVDIYHNRYNKYSNNIFLKL